MNNSIRCGSELISPLCNDLRNFRITYKSSTFARFEFSIMTASIKQVPNVGLHHLTHCFIHLSNTFSTLVICAAYLKYCGKRLTALATGWWFLSNFNFGLENVRPFLIMLAFCTCFLFNVMRLFNFIRCSP